LDAGLAASFDLKEPRGALISAVTPDSPAAHAGLQAGDVVTSFQGKPVATRDQLRLQVAQMAPGTRAAVQVVREGRPLTIDVTLGQLADARPLATSPSIELIEGVQVATLTEQLRRESNLERDVVGVLVTSVDNRSPYGTALPVGTLIEKINKETVADVSAAREALRRGRNTLVVRYGRTRQFISLELAK
jgi:S1-C subfamily serine protease